MLSFQAGCWRWRRKRLSHIGKFSSISWVWAGQFRAWLGGRVEPFPDDQVFLHKLKKNGLIFLRYATCISPIMHLICPPKFCITFVFHFSWVLQPSLEKLKTTLMQNFGGQIRCIMGDVQVAYTSFWKNHNLVKHLGYVQESLTVCKCIQQIQTYPFTTFVNTWTIVKLAFSFILGEHVRKRRSIVFLWTAVNARVDNV